jgi:hypothetical protein
MRTYYCYHLACEPDRVISFIFNLSSLWSRVLIKKTIFAPLVKKCAFFFMEPEYSSPCSQETAIGPCPNPEEFGPQRHILCLTSLRASFLTKMLHKFIIFSQACYMPHPFHVVFDGIPTFICAKYVVLCWCRGGRRRFSNVVFKDLQRHTCAKYGVFSRRRDNWCCSARRRFVHISRMVS